TAGGGGRCVVEDRVGEAEGFVVGVHRWLRWRCAHREGVPRPCHPMAHREIARPARRSDAALVGQPRCAYPIGWLARPPNQRGDDVLGGRPWRASRSALSRTERGNQIAHWMRNFAPRFW